MSTAIRRVRAVLNYGSKKNFALLIIIAKAIYAKMMASQTVYLNSATLLGTLQSQTTALVTAQDAVNNHMPKASGPRNVARDNLLTTMELLLKLVQALADAAPSGEGAVIIEGAGMAVAAVTIPPKPMLAAKLSTLAGVVILIANASLLSTSKRKKTYGWMYTLDGKTWIAAPSTPVAHTSITGLPSMTTVGFRVNVTDTLTATDWSQTVSIMVIH